MRSHPVFIHYTGNLNPFFVLLILLLLIAYYCKLSFLIAIVTCRIFVSTWFGVLSSAYLALTLIVEFLFFLLFLLDIVGCRSFVQHASFLIY